MIDEKKIEEAAKRYCKETGCTQEETELITEGFTEGAHWAINELLKNLWHPVSEEPDVRHRIIMCLYKEGDICQDYEVYDEATEHDRFELRIGKFNWICYAEENNIEKWCYKDDLLPRKGGEK